LTVGGAKQLPPHEFVPCVIGLLCVGLTLIANVQQDQYVTEVGTTAGLIVLIQTQNLMPFPEDRGKLVSPGYQTEIAITQVRQQNLGFYKANGGYQVIYRKKFYSLQCRMFRIRTTLSTSHNSKSIPNNDSDFAGHCYITDVLLR